MIAKSRQKSADLRMDFAKWLVDPMRVGNQQDWAAEHKVDAATLSDWKRHPEVRAVLDGWREAMRPGVSQVVMAVFQRAKGGDMQAARLFGEWFGLGAPKKVDLSGKIGLMEWLGSNAEQLDPRREGESPRALPERTART